jgi:hypothetical protein
VTLFHCHSFCEVIYPVTLTGEDQGQNADCGTSSYDNNFGGDIMNAITGWGTLTVFFVFSPFIVMSLIIIFSGKPAE